MPVAYTFMWIVIAAVLIVVAVLAWQDAGSPDDAAHEAHVDAELARLRADGGDVGKELGE